MKQFIIFGHKQHGKDTVCEYLEKRFGIKFESSSMFAAKKFLFDELKTIHGYSSIYECFNDRVNHRKYWYEAIRNYNDPDRARLGRELFDVADIYCGIRDRDEFEALKRIGIADLTIWIDASDRKPPEGSESMKLNSRDADIVIDNNGTLDELYARLNKLFVAMGYTYV